MGESLTGKSAIGKTTFPLRQKERRNNFAGFPIWI
jgi:hypothetical protein